MKEVFYLGYYDTVDNDENRNYVLSASSKMTYIIEALEKSNYKANVISASQTKNSTYYNGKVVKIGKHSSLILFKTYPWGNKIRRIISVLSMRHQYHKYILKNLTPNDTLIAYHSVDYARFLAKAKTKIGFRLVLEVEEIYSDVSGKEKDREKENEVFTVADAFIFPTQMLDDKLNVDKKPSVIIHGTYKVEPQITEKFSDGKTHIVYAGTFDFRKGGAFSAVKAAEMLDDDYHIHILGFGDETDRKKLLEEIEYTNSTSKCNVSFEGLLSGKDYIKFLQRCHIGLSTQNPNGVYNDTSFPSKILSYMANGLRVVSIRIPVIETSAIGEFMYYYDEQTPEKIANAIKSVDINDSHNTLNIISNLDKAFIKELGVVL